MNCGLHGTEAACLACGAMMAPGVTACSQCGWTYETLVQQTPTDLFRKAWSLYDAISEGNHMSHRELYAALRTRIRERFPAQGGRVLDLGCGNARFLAPCFEDSKPEFYRGVDLSAVAIEEGRALLAAWPRTEWVVEDMLGHVEQSAESFDLVFSGFAIHHLEFTAKERLFREVGRLLSAGGTFLLVDVVRRDDESRGDYIAAYLHQVRTAWGGLSPEHIAETCAHIAAFDFPETGATLRSLASAAGFRSIEPLASHGPHQLWAFEK